MHCGLGQDISEKIKEELKKSAEDWEQTLGHAIDEGDAVRERLGKDK